MERWVGRSVPVVSIVIWVWPNKSGRFVNLRWIGWDAARCGVGCGRRACWDLGLSGRRFTVYKIVDGCVQAVSPGSIGCVIERGVHDQPCAATEVCWRLGGGAAPLGS